MVVIAFEVHGCIEWNSFLEFIRHLVCKWLLVALCEKGVFASLKLSEFWYDFWKGLI